MAFTKRELRLVEPMYELLDLLNWPPTSLDNADDRFYYQQDIARKRDELQRILGELEEEENV